MDWLKKLKKGKTIFCGLGNDLREDDGVGNYIARALSKHFTVFVMEEDPELYIDSIVKMHPDTVILFDAADFKGEPGDISIIPIEKIDRFTFSTHRLPLSIFVYMLRGKLDVSIHLIGIEPFSLRYREGISDKMKKVADKIIASFYLSS